MRSTRFRTFELLTLVGIGSLSILAAMWPRTLGAQQHTKRLILKDGSFQAVVKYEVQGDHVHYFSAERYEWEDIPSSLIDWPATQKYEADLEAGKILTKHEETAEEKDEREKELANSPVIAPGMRLPGTGGVFLFEQPAGKPELSEIVQNGGEVNEHTTAKKIFIKQINPLASSVQSIELKGAHAQIQAHNGMPNLYADIDEGTANDVPLENRFRIVRADIKKDIRVIGNLKVAFTGKTSENGNFVATNVQKLGTGEWAKITPAKDLAPGEYAIVEMLGPQEMNLYVWDFGVNPKAPANPSSWQPETKPAE